MGSATQLLLPLVFFALLLPSGEVQANRRALPISTDIDLNPQIALSNLATAKIGEPTLSTSSPTTRESWQEVTVRKGDKDTLDKLNAAIKQVVTDGTYDKLAAKYPELNGLLNKPTF